LMMTHIFVLCYSGMFCKGRYGLKAVEVDQKVAQNGEN
jgi:hypothetical protein